MADTLGSAKNADVVVVGGGIIGSAIALRLARAGTKVTVIDRAQPCSEASGAAAGMIAPQGEMIEPESFSQLCMASRDLYPEFVAEVESLSGESVNYRRDGTLLVAIEEHECEELDKIYRSQSQLRLPVERLTGESIHKRCPGLAQGIEVALFVGGDHWVDNHRLTHAVIAAGERSGVRFHWDCTVTGFNSRGDLVESVRALPQGASAETIYSPGRVILAAGCWSGQLAETFGVSLPIIPCHGQMIEFETPLDLPHVVRAGIHYVVPRNGQTVVAGTTAKWGSFEKVVTAGGLQSIIQGVSRILPVAEDFKFRRAWSGLRPDTKDHLPILGFGALRNMIYATGHFRNGILLAPITAKLIAELLLTGTPSQSLDAYNVRRFEGSQKSSAIP